jgi:predicted permease
MPRWLTLIRLRLRSLFHAARVDRELDEELRYHLEREIEERLAAGVDRDEARVSARRRMGAIAQNMEECRDMRRVNFVEHRIQDLRFAVRQLLKHRGFAATATLTLALGIAASVAIFGFVDASLIRPLPYEDPSRLVTVFGARSDVSSSQRRGMVSYLSFADWRARNRAFSSMAAYDVRAGFELTTATGPQRVSGLRVTSGFFRTLGVTPVLGRDFDRSEEGPAAPATVVLAHGAWLTHFGGRPDIVGQAITLQGEPHTVVGVLPRDFHFAMSDYAGFWLTIRKTQACWENRACRSMQAMARLADGVSLQMAASDMDGILQDLRRQYPERNPETARVVPLTEAILGNVRPILLMLLGGSGFLLLIACMNVVSLLLARSDSRSREIAVRDALGASSGRLGAQFATEAVVLVACGAVVGLTLAAWVMHLLESLVSPDMVSRMPYLHGISVNVRSVAFAGGVSLVAAVVFALTPILRLPRSDRLEGLKEGSRGTAGTTWQRFGRHLVTTQLALAMVLLVGAGLFGKSLYRLLTIDTGFTIDRVTVVSVAPVVASQRTELPGALARHVAERVALIPGVASVGYADHLPLGSLAPSSFFWVMGRSESDQLKEDWPVRRVSAGFFASLQARLVRGRYFTEEEVSAMRRDGDQRHRGAPVFPRRQSAWQIDHVWRSAWAWLFAGEGNRRRRGRHRGRTA